MSKKPRRMMRTMTMTTTGPEKNEKRDVEEVEENTDTIPATTMATTMATTAALMTAITMPPMKKSMKMISAARAPGGGGAEEKVADVADRPMPGVAMTMTEEAMTMMTAASAGAAVDVATPERVTMMTMMTMKKTKP